MQWCRDGDFLHPAFPVIRVQHVSDQWGHTMCRSMVDIQSVMAEIRQGKKRRKKEETTGQKYNGPPIT